MNPVVLPMLHLLCRLQDGDGLAWDIRLLSAADSQHSLELMWENLDEARNHLLPVVENPPGAAAAGQIQVARDQISDELHVLLIEQRFEIDRVQIAALLGEISTFVKNVGDTAAHAGSKIPATGAEHDHQPVRHVFAAMVAYA